MKRFFIAAAVSLTGILLASCSFIPDLPGPIGIPGL